MKMQFEAVNHAYGKDIFYGAVSLCGGSVTKEFFVDAEHRFEGNRAFHFVLFEYLRDVFGEDAFRYYADRAVCVITFIRSREELIPCMNLLLEQLFQYEYVREKFEKAKESAKAKFSARYKDEKFRSLYKAFEFSDMRKRFTLKQLITDFEQIDYDTFVNCAKMLLTAGNTCAVISGETDQIDWGSLRADLPGFASERRLWPVGYDYDPYLRRDAHIVHIARNTCRTQILAFDFMDIDTTVFTRRLILDILAAQIPEGEKYLWADPLDASIIFHTSQFRQYKELITIPDGELFEKTRMRVLSMYQNALENHPELFNITAAVFLQSGIYMDRYLEFLQTCTPQLFSELCRKADYKISEAQIFLGKASE